MLPTGPDPEIGGSSPPPPSGADPGRFAAAIAAIDEANAADPNVLVVDGVARPKELVHAEAMTFWVRRLDADADEAQLLAARAHHFQRWTYPRSAEPEGRAAYLRWRTEAKRRQAVAVAELLKSQGYDDGLIDRVRALVAKEGLGRGGLVDVDGRAPAVQTHEDALCLVFLTTQFDPVADQLGDDKMIDVLARTLGKMSDRGRREAFALPLDDRAAALVVEAAERSVLPAEASEPVRAGLDLLLATPVDELAEGEGHDETDASDSAPVILVDASLEARDGGAQAEAAPPPELVAEPLSGGVGFEVVDDAFIDSAPRDFVSDPDDRDDPEFVPDAEPSLPRRASSVRRAMLWGERSHPPPVTAPPPPLPLDAPAAATPAAGPEHEPRGVRGPVLEVADAEAPSEDLLAPPPGPIVEPPKGRRWFGRGSGGDTSPAVAQAASQVPAPAGGPTEDTMPMSAPVELAVPAEPDAGPGAVDPWGLEVAVARLSAGARRAASVPLGIVSTMLVEGEVVEAVVQGEYQHHPAVVVLTSRRVLIANQRQWSPDVRTVAIGADVVVQGWQDDRRATLVFGHRGRGLVVSGIVDRPLARELAGRVRELVASHGGPPA